MRNELVDIERQRVELSLTLEPRAQTLLLRLDELGLEFASSVRWHNERGVGDDGSRPASRADRTRGGMRRARGARPTAPDRPRPVRCYTFVTRMSGRLGK